MSVITPYAIEKVPRDISVESKTRTENMPEIAKACRTLRLRSAEYDFDKAIAILAARYRLKVIIYIGRRPSTSAASPTRAGAIVATAMYEVTVRLILSTETDNVWDSTCIAG